MVKEMLWVLMDDIKDANMLMDYYEESDNPEDENFFHAHAKKRMDEVMSDYGIIKARINLDQKVREGDVIAEALNSHLDHEVMMLRQRMM